MDYPCWFKRILKHILTEESIEILSDLHHFCCTVHVDLYDCDMLERQQLEDVKGSTPLSEAFPEIAAVVDRNEPLQANRPQRIDLGDVVLTYVWDVDPEKITPRLPSHIAVSLKSSADPRVHQRGISSGILRMVSEALQDEGKSFHHTRGHAVADDGRTEVLRRLVDQLERMYPNGPRSNPRAYYERFMAIFEWWQDTGAPSPAMDMRKLMGMEKKASTFWARIKAAERYLSMDDNTRAERIEKAARWALEAQEQVRQEVTDAMRDEDEAASEYLGSERNHRDQAEMRRQSRALTGDH